MKALSGALRQPIAIFCALTMLSGVASFAEQPKDGRVERTGPLMGLPSPAGPHLDKIKSLADNEWLDLGAPAPDPKWGKARGRSWGAKMPYAPDLQGAFLAGQGVHGYAKPDGRFDDIFFYDLNAHRWICIYPGINTRTFVEDIKRGAFKVSDDGQLVDNSGQPVFWSFGGYSYMSHTYDTDRRQYIAGGGSGLGGCQHSTQTPWHKEGMKLLRDQMQGKTDRVARTPYHFHTLTGKWERYATDGYRPAGGFINLCYLPSQKALWHYGDGQTSLGDCATHQWSNAKAKGLHPPGIDFGVCQDSKRDCLYVCGGSYRAPYAKGEGKVYRYDVQTNTWSNLPDKGAVPDRFDSNDACVHYDSANDHMIVFVYTGERKGVYFFDAATHTWSDKVEPLPARIARRCWNGFYSPEVNAHFFHIAGDSDDNGVLWVYRYKRTAK